MEQTTNLAASIAIKNKNNVWINDNMVITCHNFRICNTTFSWYYRKHHCRSCGNIFCYKCLNQSIVIPNFIIDKPDPADYWNPSHYVKELKQKEDKVCIQCYQHVKDRLIAHGKIVEIFNNPCTMDQVRYLSVMDENVKDYYLDHLRNIQYYLPNHSYSQIDKRLLRANVQYFSQHSKYMVHLIKSIDWNSSNTKPDFILKLFDSPKNKSCGDMYCTRTCQEILSFDDCINILYSCANTLPAELLNYSFSLMIDTPTEVITCHLPFFATLIKNSTNKILHGLIFDLIKTSKKIIYHIFWLLTNEKNDTIKVTDPDCVIDDSNINNFLSFFDKDLINKMQAEYCFYAELIDNLDNPVSYLTMKFDEYKPITVPYDPELLLVGVYIDDIVIKDSCTKPVIITFETNFGCKRLLFKRESIMNDLTVLNLITLSDIILKESLDIDFGTTTYPVMPLTSSSGMIEIIENAETIYSVCDNKKALWQYIFEKNNNKIISDVMKTYMRSLVSYTLHSYFIGLGDRHLQNIMITADGRIFHIDFGFILGKDAYPIISSDIKLNTNILDVLGDNGESTYNEYLELCNNGVIILRKYFNMFFILLSQLKNNKIKEKHIEKFIMSRFQPRQTDQMVFHELLSIIQQSNNAYIDIIRDFLHYHTQEKTVQNGFGGVVNSAFCVIKNITTGHT